ncbi:putative leader peptide [Streptomyces sp. NPDC056500]|uniref:putative leader peptide n=1 Tax=Streptomyces sp. NPDC056500 TaxID=3345840 RepID=UPI0036B15F5D
MYSSCSIRMGSHHLSALSNSCPRRAHFGERETLSPARLCRIDPKKSQRYAPWPESCRACGKAGGTAVKELRRLAGLTRRRHVDLVRVSSALCPIRD